MKLDKHAFAERFIEMFPEKREKYLKHIADYGELLEHILFSDEIARPLYELLKTGGDDALIARYVRAIEMMLRDGDDEVVNVLDVTVLEYLSYEDEIWRRLGKYISDDLRDYINNVLIKENMAMRDVSPIK